MALQVRQRGGSRGVKGKSWLHMFRTLSTRIVPRVGWCGGLAPTDDNLTIKQLYAAFYELRPRAATRSLSLFLWSLRSNR